ncbi:MAG: TIR domain-containing protein [Sedimentisphaerales bacterium]|jgi:hypothetical protein
MMQRKKEENGLTAWEKVQYRISQIKQELRQFDNKDLTPGTPEYEKRQALYSEYQSIFIDAMKNSSGLRYETPEELRELIIFLDKIPQRQIPEDAKKKYFYVRNCAEALRKRNPSLPKLPILYDDLSTGYQSMIEWCDAASEQKKGEKAKSQPARSPEAHTEHIQTNLTTTTKNGKKTKLQPKGLSKNTTRNQVFICYSHKDKRWLNDLQTHLKPYVRNRLVTVWSDKKIVPGSKSLPEIEAALASAKVAALLVTPDFLASDFINDKELGPLLKKAKKGKVKIIWILVRACSYKETPLKDYQAAVNLDKPLANMKKADRDKAWVKICEEIDKAVKRGAAKITRGK